jgi:hypothetical protein
LLSRLERGDSELIAEIRRVTRAGPLCFFGAQ